MTKLLGKPVKKADVDKLQRAKNFYSSFGFTEVSMDEDGEDMLAIIKL